MFFTNSKYICIATALWRTGRYIDALNPEHDASKCCIVLQDWWHTWQLRLKFGLSYSFIRLCSQELVLISTSWIANILSSICQEKSTSFNQQLVLLKSMFVWNGSLVRNRYSCYVSSFLTFWWCLICFFKFKDTAFLVHIIPIYIYIKSISQLFSYSHVGVQVLSFYNDLSVVLNVDVMLQHLLNSKAGSVAVYMKSTHQC